MRHTRHVDGRRAGYDEFYLHNDEVRVRSVDADGEADDRAATGAEAAAFFFVGRLQAVEQAQALIAQVSAMQIARAEERIPALYAAARDGDEAARDAADTAMAALAARVEQGDEAAAAAYLRIMAAITR